MHDMTRLRDMVKMVFFLFFCREAHLVLRQGFIPRVNEGRVIPDLFVAEDILVAGHDCFVKRFSVNKVFSVVDLMTRRRTRCNVEMCENLSQNLTG